MQKLLWIFHEKRRNERIFIKSSKRSKLWSCKFFSFSLLLVESVVELSTWAKKKFKWKLPIFLVFAFILWSSALICESKTLLVFGFVIKNFSLALRLSIDETGKKHKLYLEWDLQENCSSRTWEHSKKRERKDNAKPYFIFKRRKSIQNKLETVLNNFKMLRNWESTSNTSAGTFRFHIWEPPI